MYTAHTTHSRELGPKKPKVPVTYMEQTHKQTNTTHFLDIMLLAVHRWPTGGRPSGPLEICPDGSPSDLRRQPP